MTYDALRRGRVSQRGLYYSVTTVTYRRTPWFRNPACARVAIVELRESASNVLLQAEKRGRIGTGDVATRLDLIAELPILVDQETVGRAWREIPTIARAEGLRPTTRRILNLPSVGGCRF